MFEVNGPTVGELVAVMALMHETWDADDLYGMCLSIAHQWVTSALPVALKSGRMLDPTDFIKQKAGTVRNLQIIGFFDDVLQRMQAEAGTFFGAFQLYSTCHTCRAHVIMLDIL